MEEIGHEFHGIAAHHGTILVVSGGFGAAGEYSKTDVFGDFGAYFKAEYCLVG